MEIRLATQEDACQLAEYYRLNAPHFRPWEPIRESEYYSEESLRTRFAELEKNSNYNAAHFVGLEDGRVMANYMPVNSRSGLLLKKLGFSEEGLARKYLYINGNWEDHVLTALLNPALGGSN